MMPRARVFFSHGLDGFRRITLRLSSVAHPCSSVPSVAK